MDAISSTCRSIEAVNQVLQQAQAKTLDVAKRMLQVNIEITVGKENGKGAAIDEVA
jgi:hypothetical protein